MTRLRVLTQAWFTLAVVKAQTAQRGSKGVWRMASTACTHARNVLISKHANKTSSTTRQQTVTMKRPPSSSGNLSPEIGHRRNGDSACLVSHSSRIGCRATAFTASRVLAHGDRERPTSCTGHARCQYRQQTGYACHNGERQVPPKGGHTAGTLLPQATGPIRHSGASPFAGQTIGSCAISFALCCFHV